MVYSFYLCNLLLSAVELPFPVMLVGTWLLYCKDLTNKYLVYIRLSTHCIGCTWTFSLQYNTWRSRCWYEPKRRKSQRRRKSPPLLLTRGKKISVCPSCGWIFAVVFQRTILLKLWIALAEFLTQRLPRFSQIWNLWSRRRFDWNLTEFYRSAETIGFGSCRRSGSLR